MTTCDTDSWALLTVEHADPHPRFGIIGATRRVRLALFGHDYEPTCGYVACSCPEHHPRQCIDPSCKHTADHAAVASLTGQVPRAVAA